MGNTETMFDRNSYQRFLLEKKELNDHCRNRKSTDKEPENVVIKNPDCLNSIRLKEFEAGICLIR